MKNTKRWLQIFAVLGALLAFAGTASAHVTVWPKETTTSAYEKYTVRVPVEKDVNTTKVRLEFPAGFTMSTVQPIPNWSYELEKDSEQRITAVTWTATNGGIKAHEFIEFSFVGKNPKETGTLAWKAYQTYADGSVVEWTGEPGSDTPASVTTIKQAATEDGHSSAEAASTGVSEGTISLVLSGLALLLSLISLFRKRA
jgi:LPXTG-motif cell wall-anchored protein